MKCGYLCTNPMETEREREGGGGGGGMKKDKRMGKKRMERKMGGREGGKGKKDNSYRA